MQPENHKLDKTSATAYRRSPARTAVLLLGPVYADRRAPACSRRRRQAGAGVGPCTLGYTNVVAVALSKTAATVRKCAFSPNCWGTGGGWGVGRKWAPIGGLQYQTHMQAPKYDVQFLRSEALRSSSSSSSSSSRTLQIKECYIRMTVI